MSEAPHVVAMRDGYDSIASAYASAFADVLSSAPLDRALLAGFAELVLRDHPDSRVLDVGCGPGVVTAHLAALGLAVRGLDLSPAMVGVARRDHSEVSFEVGDMAALAVPDASLAALVSWYSLIHVPPAHQADVLVEWARVLRPGGYLLVAFQVSNDTLHLDEAFGRPVCLDFHRLRPEAVLAMVEAAGLDPVATLVRAPTPHPLTASVPQGFVIAQAESL